MKRALSFTLALAIAGISAGFSFAQEGVKIVYVKNLEQGGHGSFLPPFTPAMHQEAQAVLASDAELKDALVKHSVQLDNILGIEKMANGHRVVFVK